MFALRYFLRMSALTQDHFDSSMQRIDQRLDRLESNVSALLEATRSGFAANETRFQKIETTLVTLVESVDRLAKIYTDLNQELVVMRQHLRDVEARVEQLELKLKAA